MSQKDEDDYLAREQKIKDLKGVQNIGRTGEIPLHMMSAAGQVGMMEWLMSKDEGERIKLNKIVLKSQLKANEGTDKSTIAINAQKSFSDSRKTSVIAPIAASSDSVGKYDEMKLISTYGFGPVF